MVQGHQDCQLHSSSSHHERTYQLSRQEWCKGIKTVSFISAPATMRELTRCQGKNGARASRLSASLQLQPTGELTSCQGRNDARASRLSASFQLQPPRENLLSVKIRIVQGHQDCQL